MEIRAINNAMDALRENEPFTLTDLPESTKAVGAEFMCCIKGDGNKKLHNPRLVATGFN